VYGTKKSTKKKASDYVVAPSEIRQVVGIIYAVRLKEFLKSFYNISGAHCKNYDPATVTDNKLTPLSTVVPVELNDVTPMVTLDEIQGSWWEDSTVCRNLYSVLKEVMDNDENDLSIVPSQSSKRGRKRANSGDTSKQKKRKKTSTESDE